MSQFGQSKPQNSETRVGVNSIASCPIICRLAGDADPEEDWAKTGPNSPNGLLVSLEGIDLVIRVPIGGATCDSGLKAAANPGSKSGCLEICAQPLGRLPKHEVAPCIKGIEFVAVLVAIEGKLRFDTGADRGHMPCGGIPSVFDHDLLALLHLRRAGISLKADSLGFAALSGGLQCRARLGRPYDRSLFPEECRGFSQLHANRRFRGRCRPRSGSPRLLA